MGLDEKPQCCALCFGDRHLLRRIPEVATEKGTCSFCVSENQYLVEPLELRDQFEMLASIYAIDESGDLLIKWLKQDWSMFEHPTMNDVRCDTLLSQILGAELMRQRFVPAGFALSDSLARWEKFRWDLMNQNRFFPQTRLNLERLEELLSYLLVALDEFPDEWYRARLQTADKPYPIEEMGAPPQQMVSHGRANPAGIPYLYLASTPETAVSEVRPQTGEIASVADFLVPTRISISNEETKDLKIADLRHPRKTVSPFEMGDEFGVALLRGDLDFLEHLGDELTRPVLPRSAAIDYLPSQYFCEFVKNCGFDGVLYRSAVADGINVALFDPRITTAGSVTRHRISRVLINLDKV